MLEDNLFEDEIFDGELEQVWLVAEALSRDITEQLADLHTLKGAAFISIVGGKIHKNTFRTKSRHLVY